MSDALIVLHFQNDICHRQGQISFSLNRDRAAARFLGDCKRALAAARQAGWTIAHMHVVYAEDYSDLPRNCRLFRKVATLTHSSVAPGERRHSLASNRKRTRFSSPAPATAPSTVPTSSPGFANARSIGSTSSAWRPNFRSSIPCATLPTSAIPSGCWPIAARPAIPKRMAPHCARLPCWRTWSTVRLHFRRPLEINGIVTLVRSNKRPGSWGSRLKRPKLVFATPADPFCRFCRVQADPSVPPMDPYALCRVAAERAYSRC